MKRYRSDTVGRSQELATLAAEMLVWMVRAATAFIDKPRTSVSNVDARQGTTLQIVCDVLGTSNTLLERSQVKRGLGCAVFCCRCRLARSGEGWQMSVWGRATLPFEIDRRCFQEDETLVFLCCVLELQRRWDIE